MPASRRFRDIKLTVARPPEVELASGLSYFLPEFDYFRTKDPEWCWEAALTVSLCIGHLATWYMARCLVNGTGEREGDIAGEREDRERLITDIFGWMRSIERTPNVAGLVFERMDGPLLLAGDGIPGALALTDQEFLSARECWTRRGLPTDLYYPVSEQVQFIGPIVSGWTVVRARQRYSPRVWKKVSRRPAPPEPDEQERRRHFTEVCLRFKLALLGRVQEVTEVTGDPVDDELLGKLSDALHMVRELEKRHRQQ